MENVPGTREHGVNILGVITIVMIILKSMHRLDLPWIVVFSPLWIPLVGLSLIVFSIFILDKALDIKLFLMKVFRKFH